MNAVQSIAILQDVYSIISKYALAFFEHVDKETHTHNRFMALFPDGHHSIRLISDPPSSPIFITDAIPAATLPLYPGLGQAQNMLACMPSGVVTNYGHQYAVIV